VTGIAWCISKALTGGVSVEKWYGAVIVAVLGVAAGVELTFIILTMGVSGASVVVIFSFFVALVITGLLLRGTDR